MYLSYDAGDSRAISDKATGTSGSSDSAPPGEAEGQNPGAEDSPRESPRQFRVTRVSPVNRSQASALVQAALQSGRIVQADHDMRLDQIKNAASDQDIDMIVRDLQNPVPAAVGATAATTTATPGQQPWPLVNYGPAPGQAATASADLTQLTKTGGKWVGGIIGLVVLISVIVPIVGVIIGLVSAKDTFDDFDFAEPVDETTYLPGQEPGENGVNVHTIDGLEEMLAGLEEETGGTTVYSATIYPRYAVIAVPEGEAGKRYRNYFWDGHSMELQDFKSTTDDPRIDLTIFDPGTMITLLEDVRGRIDDPSSWYVSLGSDSINGTPQISAYANNEYGEGSYVLATADGTITYESTYP